MRPNEDARPDESVGAGQENTCGAFHPHATAVERCPACHLADLNHERDCALGRSLDGAAVTDRAVENVVPIRGSWPRRMDRPLAWGEVCQIAALRAAGGLYGPEQPEDLTAAVMTVMSPCSGLRFRGVGPTIWFVDVDLDIDGALDAFDDFVEFCGGFPSGYLSTLDTANHVATCHMHSVWEVAA